MNESWNSACPSAARGRIVSGLCSGVAAVVLAALVVATLSFELHILRTSSFGRPYPFPIYPLMPIPETSPVAGLGAAGADFSQVYTGALALRHGESAYRPESPEFTERFGRPPGLPPLMNWVYVPLSLLPYHAALLAHTAISLLALLGATALVLWKSGLRRHVWRVTLAQASLYFLTPIGLTHLERGQFDLIVAASTVLCFACVFVAGNSFGLAAASGFLGALKWTAVPFVWCFSALGFLLGFRSRVFLTIPSVMVLGTVLFWRGLLEYWSSIQVYELDALPEGLTLQHFVPRLVAKMAPVAVTLSCALFVVARYRSHRERAQVFVAISAPFALALANLAVCFATISYEYHTVTTLGMIPCLVLWTEKEPSVPTRVKAVTCVAFGTLLVVTFRVFGLNNLFDSVAMARVYSFFTLLFFGLCAYTILSLRISSTDASPVTAGGEVRSLRS